MSYERKISVLGEIIAIHSRANDALKELYNFMSGSEMFTPDDLTQADTELKSAVKKINNIKDVLKVFRELADKRYVENARDNKNSVGETA